MDKCKYYLAWIGECGKPAKGNFCDEHLKKKCDMCGEQSTGQCEDDVFGGSLTCGMPLCRKGCHKHRV